MEPIILSGSAIIEDEKLLLLYKDNDSFYEFPGGAVEEDETLEQTAIRETMEETFCRVVLKKHLTTIDFVKDNKKFISHLFLAEIESGEPYTDGIEHSDVLWMEIKDYKNYSLAPNVITFCERYLNKEINV